MNDEVEEKIKNFSRQELYDYHRAIMFINKCVNVVAVSTILLVLFFTNVFSIVAGTIAVYMLGNFSCAINTTKLYIRAKLRR